MAKNVERQKVKVLSSPLQEAAQRPIRLFFVDNIRIPLSMLVVIAHLANVYGGPGFWYYKEGTTDQVAANLLSYLVIVNQNFLMGLFFMISAYFMPESYDRKGPLLFLKDKLLRLGIPLLIYDLLLNPLTLYIGGAVPIPFGQFLKQYLLHFPGPGNGPAWFLLVLLLFTFAYMLWRWLSGKRTSSFVGQAAPPAPGLIVVFTLAV